MQAKLKVSRTLLASAMLLAIAEMASAQTAITLPAVTVEAKAIADNVSTITSEDLEKRQAKDLRDAFQNEPGVTVGGGGGQIAQKIYVRGIDDALVNVSIDGANQGGYIYHHQGRVQIEPALIKQIEVEKGTGGATAGPGALAGSIRVETKDAKDLLRPGQAAGFMAGGGVSSNKGWNANSAIYGRLGNVADMLYAVSKQDNQDYKAGNGEKQLYSGNDFQSDLAKFNWYLAPGHTLGLTYNHQEDTGPRYLRPNMIAFGAQQLLMPRSFERETTTLRYRFDGAGKVPAIDIVYYNDDNINMRTNTTSGRIYGEQVTGDGLDAKLTSKLGSHTLRYGYNYRNTDAKAINPAKLGPAGNTSQETSSSDSFYLEDTIALSKQWQANVGGRYDSFKYTDNFNQSFSDSGFSPSAGINFSPTTGSTIRLSHNRALRGVGLQETFLLDNGPGANRYRNRAATTAEKAQNTELALELAQGAWSGRAAVFHQTIDNYITTKSTTFTRYNAGKLVSDGYELGVGWQGQQLSLSANVAHSKPELNGLPLNDGDFGAGVSAGRTWNLRAGYVVPRWNTEFAWNSRIVESKETVSGQDSTYRYTKEGYDIHDVTASWTPMGKDKLRLTAGIYNLFNEFYYDQSSYNKLATGGYAGYAEPGRNARLSANWEF